MSEWYTWRLNPGSETRMQCKGWQQWTSSHHRAGKAIEMGIQACLPSHSQCTQHCSPHLVDNKRVEATFQPEWTALSRNHCTKRNQALDVRAYFLSPHLYHLHSPPMEVEVAALVHKEWYSWQLWVTGKRYHKYTSQEPHRPPQFTMGLVPQGRGDQVTERMPTSLRNMGHFPLQRRWQHPTEILEVLAVQVRVNKILHYITTFKKTRKDLYLSICLNNKRSSTQKKNSFIQMAREIIHQTRWINRVTRK